MKIFIRLLYNYIYPIFPHHLLIAINISLYVQGLDTFKGRRQAGLPPHTLSVAQEAYAEMIATGNDQSVLFMGYSGAGKTTHLRNALNYLATISDSSSSQVTGSLSHLQQTNNIVHVIVIFHHWWWWCTVLIHTNFVSQYLTLVFHLQLKNYLQCPLFLTHSRQPKVHFLTVHQDVPMSTLWDSIDLANQALLLFR